MADALEALVGDMVMARCPMRSWESEHERGNNGRWIAPGEQALVVASWTEGSQRRFKVLRDNRVMLFSMSFWLVSTNWEVIMRPTRLPTSPGT